MDSEWSNQQSGATTPLNRDIEIRETENIRVTVSCESCGWRAWVDDGIYDWNLLNKYYRAAAAYCLRMRKVCGGGSHNVCPRLECWAILQHH